VNCLGMIMWVTYCGCICLRK